MCIISFDKDERLQEIKPVDQRGDERNIPPDEEACREEIDSQEEVYLETTEEELRADLISELAAAKHWRMNREKLESDWERDISDDECK